MFSRREEKEEGAEEEGGRAGALLAFEEEKEEGAEEEGGGAGALLAFWLDWLTPESSAFFADKLLRC